MDQEVRDLARANLIERELKSKLTTVARSRYVQLRVLGFNYTVVSRIEAFSPNYFLFN